MDELKKACLDIKSLKIQGATNVAKYAVKTLKDFAYRHKELQFDELWNKIEEGIDLIYDSRDTEPAMRNGLEFIHRKLKLTHEEEGKSIDIAEEVGKYSERYLQLLMESKTKIAKIGANRIPNKGDPQDFTIFTHCHSSSVTGILLEAWRQKKRFNVICTETRPKYQGRITAKELIDEGIPTKMVVDSAMRWAVRTHDIKMIITGADAITSEGTVLNKIGSRLLALVCREMHIPYYVATPLLKFNPDTAFGILEKIDMRSWKEVWPEKPKPLNILNPAFETVSRRYIDGLITEAGIFPATIVFDMFYHTYPFYKNKK
ncbi:MAG: S-methyl-5-thioribose-1-phosphate isomerase [Candidatus Lokiarchaeota archaeon]|nr:S-methyl-5-thioribose-1-phosphate isomerase [Candidatus Lokiarchaeota archaeon]